MVSGGDYNSIALRSDGTVWKWGLNDVGELGLGTNDNAGVGPAVDLISHPFPMQVTLDKFGNGFSNLVGALSIERIERVREGWQLRQKTSPQRAFGSLR